MSGILAGAANRLNSEAQRLLGSASSDEGSMASQKSWAVVAGVGPGTYVCFLARGW